MFPGLNMQKSGNNYNKCFSCLIFVVKEFHQSAHCLPAIYVHHYIMETRHILKMFLMCWNYGKDCKLTY